MINKRSVMTAAHCIVNDFDYAYGGKSYKITLTLNKYYPTWGSMYTVYAGVNDISFYSARKNPSPPGVKLAIAEVIKVFFFFQKY